MFNTPILFLIFNRPDTTEQVFESIRLIKPKKLYVAADGPRSNKPSEHLLCEQTREIINTIDWDCEVKTLYRKENLGCKIAVSSAIDWFFENEEQGIILEDDCLPNKSFFYYCDTLLDKYKHDFRIMHIGGCILPHNYKRKYQYSYFYTKLPSIWGWATWRRAWKLYDVNMKNYETFNNDGLLNDTILNPSIRHFHKGIYDEIFFNNKDTWDYQWNYAILSNYGLAVSPIKSMVKNIGFNTNALNSTDINSELANIEQHELSDISHPHFVIHNTELEYDYLKSKAYPSFIFRTKIYRKFKHYFSKK